MASLRDFVSDNQIVALRTTSVSARPQPVTIQITNNIPNANQGVELSDAIYELTRLSPQRPTGTTIWRQKLTATYSKVDSSVDDFYPVLCFSINLDESVTNTYGMLNHTLHQLDYTDSFVIDNIGYQGTVTLADADGGNMGGFHDGDLVYNQYYESGTMYQDGSGFNAFPEFMSAMSTPWVVNQNESTYSGIVKIPQYVRETNYTDVQIVTLNTNIPVLVFDLEYVNDNYQDLINKLHSYRLSGDISTFYEAITEGHCVLVNYYRQPSVAEGTKSFQMYSDVYKGVWDVDSPENETFKEYRYLQLWVAPNGAYLTPRVALYKDPVTVDGYNELRANIKIYGDLTQIKYSTDGGNSWTTVEDPDSLPFDYMYYKRTDEVGPLVYDKNHAGNILLYANESLADEGSYWLSEDYGDKGFYYPTINTTGDDEIATLMGTPGLENGFCERYILNKADIDAIANDLLSSDGMSDDLKKGVEMLGENPINAVHGLMYFPVNVATLFNAMVSNTIFIGGYALQTPSGMKMNGYNGYFDVGAMEILESFPSGDYRNYEPYCNLNIYLPFIGLEQLKMNKYVGKTLGIRYYLDVISGKCMACLFADGLLTDYFIGQMGISLSISLNDYSQYASAQISGTKAMFGNQMSVNPATQLANLTTDLQVGGLGGLGTASVFNVSSNALSNFATTKGTDSSMLNHYLPNYVYVIFEIIETDETSNLLTLEGRRSNASGTVGSFSGFLQVETVNLKASGATESEKQTIKSLLASGIYI